MPPATLLIIEDNEDVREVLSNALTIRGYRTLEASSPALARDMLAEQPVDLVLLDLMLEGTSGLELVEELRPLTDAPIVSMSASDLLLAESRLWDEFADFLPKPFGLDELVACVERNLPNSEAGHGG